MALLGNCVCFRDTTSKASIRSHDHEAGPPPYCGLNCELASFAYLLWLTLGSWGRGRRRANERLRKCGAWSWEVRPAGAGPARTWIPQASGWAHCRFTLPPLPKVPSHARGTDRGNQCVICLGLEGVNTCTRKLRITLVKGTTPDLSPTELHSGTFLPPRSKILFVDLSLKKNINLILKGKFQVTDIWLDCIDSL